MRNSPQTLRVWVTSEYCPVLMKNGLKVEKEGGGVEIHSVAIVIIIVISQIFISL